MTFNLKASLVYNSRNKTIYSISFLRKKGDIFEYKLLSSKILVNIQEMRTDLRMKNVNVDGKNEDENESFEADEKDFEAIKF